MCQSSTIPASLLGGVAVWWKESPPVDVTPRRGLLLPFIWLLPAPSTITGKRETRSGCWWSTLGSGVKFWQQPASSSPVPGCGTLITSAISASRTDGSCQTSGCTCAFALFRLTLLLSIPRECIYLSHFVCTRHHVSLKSGSWGYSCLVTCYNYAPKALL